MRCTLLISYWIEGTDASGSHGFGVTAYSPEDAIALILDAGFPIDSKAAVVHRNIRPHEVDHLHVAPNSGPSVFRGVWYPCLSIGWGASGQH